MTDRSGLWQVTRELSLTAMGKLPADLIIKNGNLVNVFTGEIEQGTDVAVKNGRIALVGDASGIEGRQIVDAGGLYITPGFMDGHLHVESSMMTVGEYAKTVIPHGTTAIFMDPHEIVNVMGLDGMKAMMRDGEQSALRVYTTTPSCVPASPGLENTGGSVTPEDVEETMRWPGVAGLGEMMNFVGVVNGDRRVHEITARALKSGKPVTGHFPSDNTGAMLNAYAACGISSCHESTTPEEALMKMRRGMYAMIREGSAWDDLPQVIRAVTEHRIDTRMAVLVSDDLHADTLLQDGHMDSIIRYAVRCGVNPITAIQMATINCASCFGLLQDIGAVAPGRYADINLLSSLSDVKVKTVMIGGKTVAEAGAGIAEAGHYEYPDAFRHSVKNRRIFTAADFTVRASGNRATVNVIGIHEGNVLTTRLNERLPVTDGQIPCLPGSDIAKVSVINRHSPKGGLFTGFVKGFKLDRGAVASTYAHDAHNLMVVGAGDKDMAFAANTLVKSAGGMVAVLEGRVLALFEMPIAGLMSDKPAAEVAANIQKLAAAWEELGSPIVSPFMTMSLLSLAVIPSLRITDKGLVDVESGAFLPLIC